MIAGVLLAAGRSTRFGGDKLLALLHGRPVLAWSASALAAEVDALILVVPPGSAARIAALGGIPAVVVEHAARDDGLASSIRAGIASPGAGRSSRAASSRVAAPCSTMTAATTARNTRRRARLAGRLAGRTVAIVVRPLEPRSPRPER